MNWVAAWRLRLCRYVGLLKKYHHTPVEGNCLVQNHHNHPVRRSLPPLHRRGMIRPYCFHELGGAWRLRLCRYVGLLKKYHHAPVEGNCLVQNHPVRLRLPPLQRRGMIRPYCFHELGGAWRLRLCRYVGLLKKYYHAPVEGNCLVQNHYNHPVRLRLPPLHRRGMY